MSKHDDDGPAAPAQADGASEYLTYADIRELIHEHLDDRSLMIDVHTRFLLSRLGIAPGRTAPTGAERPAEEG